MKTRMRLTQTSRRRWSIAAGCTLLAFGAIVLARSHGQAALIDLGEPSESATRLSIDTPELEGFVALTQGSVLAEGTREVFGELRVTARRVDGAAVRQPVALAVALDVSGSMHGEKIEQARSAVNQLISRMHAEDRVAIVVYNHDAMLVQPLAPVSAVRETLHARINELVAMGGTNIPSGLNLASQSLDAAPGGMVRRLVLVSDGLDGSGTALSLVQIDTRNRAGGGTTTSALGVGIDYDEAWLTGVADAGRGNYEFLAQGQQLTAFLTRELEQASTTVANATEARLTLPAGWRLAEVYGAETRTDGLIPIGALFAGERRRVTMRFEVSAGAPGTASEVGVGLRYRAVRNSSDRNLELGRLSLRVVSTEAEVSASRDVTLHAEAVSQMVDARQAAAVQAWREGNAQEAERMTQQNMQVLRTWQAQAPQAAPSIAPRVRALEADRGNFGSLSADSAEGRAYGLDSNASRRARTEAF
jgi:Ca-activated chloride channel homolog